jgi:elongation factor G
VILERMEFPEPVIELAIEPKSKADQEKMGMALSKLAAEDPSFRVSPTMKPARPFLKAWASCISKLSWIVLKRRTYKVDANVGAPQVAYRETISKPYRRGLYPQKAVGWFGSVCARHHRFRAA